MTDVCFNRVRLSVNPPKTINYFVKFSPEITDDSQFLCAVSASGPTPRLMISLMYNSYFMFTDLIFRRWLYSCYFF